MRGREGGREGEVYKERMEGQKRSISALNCDCYINAKLDNTHTKGKWSKTFGLVTEVG